MKILIDIPKEFEVDYNSDRFADFFQRCLANMGTCCGNYEQETAEMMEKAFAESRLYDLDKVVEQLKALTGEECTLHECGIRSEHCKACIAKKAIEIVKGGGADQELECKWKLEEEGNLYVTECENRHIVFDGTPEENGYRYCPYCGKKIKEVD